MTAQPAFLVPGSFELYLREEVASMVGDVGQSTIHMNRLLEDMLEGAHPRKVSGSPLFS